MESLKLIRNVFFKCFIIGIVFNVILALFFPLGVIEWGANLNSSLLGVDKELFTTSAFYMLAFLKAGNVLLFLIPTLGMHAAIHCKCCQPE